LAFSADGDIAVIECKLAANQEIKRKVVGQILEYGAYLWGMTYEEVDDRIYGRIGRRLADLVGDAAEAESWDEEAFRGNVATALEKGSLILLIAVDQINEELARTIQFINGCAQSAFSFSALEMRRFQAGEIDMLVPHVHGVPARVKPASTSKKGKPWTEERFFDQARVSLPSPAVQVIRDLYGWSVEKADHIKWGTGVEKGSFSFHCHRDGKLYSVFSVLTDGQLWINYNSLSAKLPEEALHQFHNSLHEIPGFRHIPADFAKWPVVWIENALVGQPEAVAQFKIAVAGLVEQIHS
jgi:hypothetical protein